MCIRDRFQGAVFRGHNFFDNLGSAMIAADDYDDDGRNEIVLVSQFGKPFFFSQGGRGAGEAYMIYGQALRYSGDYEVNNVGAENLPASVPKLPGTIFTGPVPNPYPGNALRVLDDGTTISEPQALAGNSIPYTPDGAVAREFETEGLRSVALIPDQDDDGKRELVFGIPYCNSYSLHYQSIDGLHPAPVVGIGRLENNGHFLRGGLIILSSRNPLLVSRTTISRHLDRVLHLDEVGQVFSPMTPSPSPPGLPIFQDNCPDLEYVSGGWDTVTFPCEGFWQRTDGGYIEPPRLADPINAFQTIIHPDVDTYGCYVLRNRVNLDQIDPPYGPPSYPAFLGGRIVMGRLPDKCPASAAVDNWPPRGTMQVLGTGFYGTGTNCAEMYNGRATPLPPYGCRLLGKTTSQVDPRNPDVLVTRANRFGHSISVSGDFLLVGAPLRTVTRSDVLRLPTPDRPSAATST